MTVVNAPTLISIASDINAAHALVCQAATSALEHARRAGELLSQAKDDVSHGAWLSWLSESCPSVSARVAQGYMRIAREWPRLESVNTKRDSHLPVRQALAMLAEPKPPIEIVLVEEVEQIDWTARAADMDAAWDDLGAALDELRERQPTSLEEAAENLHLATELEARTLALYASTIRDLRVLTRWLAKANHMPAPSVTPLSNPKPLKDFFTALGGSI